MMSDKVKASIVYFKNTDKFRNLGYIKANTRTDCDVHQNTHSYCFLWKPTHWLRCSVMIRFPISPTSAKVQKNWNFITFADG